MGLFFSRTTIENFVQEFAEDQLNKDHLKSHLLSNALLSMGRNGAANIYATIIREIASTEGYGLNFGHYVNFKTALDNKDYKGAFEGLETAINNIPADKANEKKRLLALLNISKEAYDAASKILRVVYLFKALLSLTLSIVVCAYFFAPTTFGLGVISAAKAITSIQLLQDLYTKLRPLADLTQLVWHYQSSPTADQIWEIWQYRSDPNDTPAPIQSLTPGAAATVPYNTILENRANFVQMPWGFDSQSFPRYATPTGATWGSNDIKKIEDVALKNPLFKGPIEYALNRNDDATFMLVAQPTVDNVPFVKHIETSLQQRDYAIRHVEAVKFATDIFAGMIGIVSVYRLINNCMELYRSSACETAVTDFDVAVNNKPKPGIN